MTTSSFERLWQKLAKSKKYREQFVSAFVKRSIPTQIRELMKQQELTQEKLAKQSGITQGVVSRATDLNYGSLTINTIVRIAAGLDCAFVGKYVPFSELGKMVAEMPDTAIAVIPTFEEENRLMEAVNLATPPRLERSNVIDIKSAEKELNRGRKQPGSVALTGNAEGQLTRGGGL